MEKADISIVTLVQGREKALANLIEGVVRNSKHPAELVVVHMNEPLYLLPETPFPIVQVAFKSPDILPLAAARNFAFRNASTSNIIFLDVDCIPAQDLVVCYQQAFSQQDVLWSGRVKYLDAQAMNRTDLWVNMERLSIKDPVRGGLDQFAYENFWSLNFGCSQAVFNRIGGFDEDYKGYGAEDTDFAFRARARRIDLSTIDAIAYHQHHPSYNPPLNHLKDIICNAMTFRNKWNSWPMEGWLRKFEQMGYVRREGNKYQVIKEPDLHEIQDCLKLH